jgi:hypothetical protein
MVCARWAKTRKDNMKGFGTAFAAVVMVAGFVLGNAGVSNAQTRNVREVRDALRSLSSKVDDLDYTLNYQLKNNSADRDTISQASDVIRNLKSSVRDLQTNFDQKRDKSDDVNRVADAARQLGQFLTANPQNRHIQDVWQSVRSQVDRLAANYGVSISWNDSEDPNVVKDDQGPLQKNTVTVGLSGTYSLDVAKSESLDDAIGNVNLSSEQRDDLKEKLEAPAQIAIDIRGQQVTMATSKASPVTFFADGREKSEPDGKGAAIRLKAALNGNTLTISSLGGETDYTITFVSEDGGRSLKVSRRITTNYLDQTVFAESVYTKTDDVAGLGIDNSGTNAGTNTGTNSSPGNTTTDPNGGYSDNDQNVTPTNGGSPPNSGNKKTGGNTRTGSNPRYGGAPRVATNRTGDFVVPNGVIINGTLDNEINTKVSQNNDRFRITVQSPDEYRGATIEGYVTGIARSGPVTGRSNVTFNFEKITLSDGKTYDFAGYLQSVRDTNGRDLKVDAEGSVKGGNQGTQTAKRGAIGAGIGALIGVIAGGGTGAAIGAAIGAGAGAGSVAIQGRDDIQLRKGTSVTVQSSSPLKPNQPDR